MISFLLLQSAKEEALLQLTAANNRLDGLNEQVMQLQDELLRLKREKQSIQTELSVLQVFTVSEDLISLSTSVYFDG